MNKANRLLVAATLALALIGNTQAGDYRRYDYDRHDHRPHHHYKHLHDRHYYRPAPRREHHHHRDWIGPAAVLTLGGIALGAAISQLPPAPLASYGGPPPPSGNWYYCGSSGQYYPYTNACPEGWQAVPPR